MLNLERFEDRRTPATFMVANLNGEGTGSLRQAVLDSNNSVGADTINFDSSLIGTLNINTGLLSPAGIHIDGEGLTINGPGPDKLSISAGGLSRIFDTKFSAMGTSITIRDLTLTNGYAKYTSPGTSVDFNGQGGAIFVEDEYLSLDGCVVTGNTSDKSGGGLALGFESNVTGGNGSLNVYDCTISNNKALEGNGGGINVIGEESGGRAQKLTVQDSTISGNTANWTPFDGSYHIGGGIGFTGQVNGTYGFALRNSTVTNNLGQNGVMGGGIGTLNLNGFMILNNSTVSHNQSTILNTAGVRVENSGATTKAQVSLFSTVIANNTNAGGNNSKLDDVSCHYATNWNGDNNLIGIDNGNSNFTGKNNQIGSLASPIDAKLGPLQDNGGLVQTRMPLLGSPLIATGLSNNEAFDSRGFGYPRVLDGGADIGATEFTDWVVRNTNSTGSGSLAQRLVDADVFIGTDTITFDPVLFGIARVINFSSELNLHDDLTITGPAANNLTINAAPGFRHINFASAPAGASFNMSGLILANGKSTGSGGAINADDQILTITDCILSNNQAAGGNGGAINIGPGQLNIFRCTLAGNIAATNGGAISFSKTTSFDIENCTFNDNSANGTATLQGGGAIFATQTIGAALIRSCTFAGNTTKADGGAVLMSSFVGSLNIQNSTIAYNKANGSFGGGGLARVGGLSGTMVLDSVIVGNNDHTSGTHDDVYSAFDVYGNDSAIGNFFGGSLIADATTTTLLGQNFKLGTLANNGGTIQTILPAVDSPIRDNGNNFGGLTLDQRGQPRMWNARVDIGAVELPPDYVVRNNNDGGQDSLRQQILDANTVAGAATVTFDPFYFATAKTITMAGTPMAIDQDLTITGPGANLATINAAKLSRAFTFANGVTATLSGLMLTGGHDSDGAIIQSGSGTLMLNNMSITANTANGGSRGAVYVAGGTLITNNSTFSGNSGEAGGAIQVNPAGSLVMNSCTVSGNTSASRGGGIYVVGTVSLTACTISGNINTSLGGGGLFLNLTAQSSIRNSTISGNLAPLNSGTVGGGIYLNFGSGPLSVENSTITNNLAGSGGGICRKSSTSSIAVVSSIIAGNSALIGPDILTGGTATLTDSLLGSSSGIGSFNPIGTTAALLGQPAKLGPLANNGGPTMTHALLPGSPAINKGNNLGALTTDQRGGSFARVVGGTADIGAFESELAPTVSSLVINQGLVSRSRVLQLDVAFDRILTFSGTPVTAFKLQRQSDGAVVSLSAAVFNGSTTQVSLTFLAGPVVEFKSLADGRYTLTIDSTQVSAGDKALDGNADGNPGGNYVLAGSPGNGLFRLYGDGNGDGTVNSTDFSLFRQTFGTGLNLNFDFDGSGIVNANDFAEFRKRFGLSV